MARTPASAPLPDDQRPIDWRFLRRAGAAMVGTVILALLLATLGMLVLRGVYRIDASAAVVEVHGQSNPTQADLTKRVAIDMTDPRRLLALAKQIGQVNKAWTKRYITEETAAQAIASSLVVQPVPGTDTIHVECDSGSDLNPQMLLEALLILVQERPVLPVNLTDPRMLGPGASEASALPLPQVTVQIVHPPSAPALVFPRVIPVGVILFVFFLPWLPALLWIRPRP